MKLQFTGIFDIDFQKEIERINRVFVDDQPARERQIDIIILFMDGKFNEVLDAYEKLPYSEKDECPEQEYTGLWLKNILETISYAKFETTDWKLL